MKTNVTVSLDTRLVEALDAWRAPMGVGRSKALELLMESLAEGQPELAAAVATTEDTIYFDSNGEAADPGVHHDNMEHDMVVPGSLFAQVAAGVLDEETQGADTEPPAAGGDGPAVGTDPPPSR